MVGYDELYVHCTSNSGKIMKRKPGNPTWTDFDWAGEDCAYRCGEPESMQQVRNCEHYEQNFLNQRTYENQVFCSVNDLSPIKQLKCAECQEDAIYNDEYYRECFELSLTCRRT